MSSVVHGYPSTMQDDYQLTMGLLIRQAVRSFGDTEIVHRNSAAGWGRTTYRENFAASNAPPQRSTNWESISAIGSG